jgi:hypothetical protein
MPFLVAVVLWLTALQQSGAAQSQTFGTRPAAPPRDATAEIKKGTGVIKGRVVTADGARPLRRVQISVSSPELGEARTVSTGTQGTFELKELPAGRYSVSASRAGFLGLQYGQRRPGEGGRPLQLADGQTIDRVDFALPRMSVISGRVTDEIGEPLAGVTVFPMQARYFRGRKRMVPVGGMVRTDDTGEYRLIGLIPGDYYVMGTTRDSWTVEGNEKERVGFGPTFFNGTLVVANAQAVKVTLGREVSGIDFSMVPGRVATISGTAMSSTGAPLAGESINLSQEFAGPNMSSSFGFAGAKVNADGTFTIKDIAPGEYKLTIRTSADKDRPAEGATTVVSVLGADVEGVSLVTGAGGVISGRIVTDEGTSPSAAGSIMTSSRVGTQLRVSARPVEPDSTYQRFTEDNGRVKEDGSFELTDVIGLQRLSVGPLASGWTIKEIASDGRDYADAPIDVRSGQRIEAVTIVITNKFPTLRGQLVDEKAQPAEGTVILFPDDPSKWGEGSRLVRSARPDMTGVFEVKYVPPGDYLIAPIDYAQTGAWDDPDFLKALQDNATKVTVREGAAASVNLILARR